MHFSYQCLRVVMTLVAANIVKDTLEGHSDERLVIHNRLKSFIATSYSKSDKNKAIEERVEQVINNKIEELKPYLQDDDIIEFFDIISGQRQDNTKVHNFDTVTKKRKSLRSNRIKGQIEIYDRLRNKIDKALRLEYISNNTRDLILTTFDNLIDKLNISTYNCKRKNNVRTSKILYDLWNEEWKRLKTNYVDKIKFSDRERIEDIKSFFDALYTFFSFIVKDMGMMSDKYKIKCQFPDAPTYRKHDNVECDPDSDFHHTDCKRFIICSKELRNFLLDFYNFLNDTTISAMRNYAEMYDRDADDFVEKQNIVSSINTTSSAMEKSVVEIFIKNTKSIELNIKKNKNENIKALSNYVRVTILGVIDSTKNCLNKELKGNKAKTLVRDDIVLTVRIDLENLQREVFGRLCFIFRFCNGKYKGRRSANINVVKNNITPKIESESRKFYHLTNFKMFDKLTSNRSISTMHSYATGKITRTSPLFIVQYLQ